MNVETLARLRFVGFAITGLICAGYSVAALLTDTPNPIWPWLPTTSGVIAAAIIWISAGAAGKRTAGSAFDELWDIEWAKALRFGYWFGVFLYPVYAIFMVLGWVSHSTTFASMGTAFGAAPLLAFCVITLRS